MPDLRPILTAQTGPDDPDGVAGKPYSAERADRYDWEPVGYGATAEAAETNLLELEWDLFNC